MNAPPTPPRPRATRPSRGVKVEFGTVLEISSYGPDPYLAGVGGDPWGGTSSSFLAVPATPTSAVNGRYLFRLASINIGAGEMLELVGFRQAVQIGVPITNQSPDPGDESQLLWIEQSTPGWSFPDGNISWHITARQGNPRQPTYAPRRGAPGETTDYYGRQPGLLVAAPLESVYTPPAKGLPPGDAVGSLGNFADLRGSYNTQGTAASEGYHVHGPAVMGFFCSVRQTNPERQGRVILPTDLGSFIPPETRFVAAYPNARYTGVAGSMLVRLRCL